MNAAEITALCTGIPAVIGAVTALIVALRAHSNATAALSHATYANAVTAAHLQSHDNLN